MNTQTWNTVMNETTLDFDEYEHINLDTALEVVEFKEWLKTAEDAYEEMEKEEL